MPCNRNSELTSNINVILWIKFVTLKIVGIAVFAILIQNTIGQGKIMRGNLTTTASLTARTNSELIWIMAVLGFWVTLLMEGAL